MNKKVMMVSPRDFIQKSMVVRVDNTIYFYASAAPDEASRAP